MFNLSLAYFYIGYNTLALAPKSVESQHVSADLQDT